MATSQSTATLATATRPSSILELVARSPLVAYFALAFLGAWLIIVPLALTRGEQGLGLLPFAVPGPVAFLLVQLSTFTGPLLAAVLVTAATEGREGLRQLRRRILRWRVGLGWYLVALLAPLAIWLTTFGVALGGAPLAALAQQPGLLLTAFLPYVLLFLFLPSLGEEPGWRGFALPRLQALHGPLLGTLILGALHALWHLPAFFTHLGPLTPATFVTFMVAAVAGTFLYTWVFNHTGGSVLLAMLVHGAGNAASTLMNRLIPADLPLDGWLRALVFDGWVTALGFSLAALLLVAATRGRLGYRPDMAMPTGQATRPTDAPPASAAGRA